MTEAACWLEEQSDGLGATFNQEVWRVTTLLAQMPFLGHIVRRDSPLRRMVIRRFRYLVIYRIKGDILEIVSIAHTSRLPEYWADR